MIMLTALICIALIIVAIKLIGFFLGLLMAAVSLLLLLIALFLIF